MANHDHGIHTDPSWVLKLLYLRGVHYKITLGIHRCNDSPVAPARPVRSAVPQQCPEQRPANRGSEQVSWVQSLQFWQPGKPPQKRADKNVWNGMEKWWENDGQIWEHHGNRIRTWWEHHGKMMGNHEKNGLKSALQLVGYTSWNKPIIAGLRAVTAGYRSRMVSHVEIELYSQCLNGFQFKPQFQWGDKSINRGVCVCVSKT